MGTDEIRRLLLVFQAYRQCRRLRFRSRAELERHQQDRLASFLPRLGAASRFYRPFQGKPLWQWPTMDKAAMLDHFDQINTAGLRLAEAMQVALEGERKRRFAPTLHGYTVGLSSGTSGRRGVFVVGPAEQTAWAGVMLAKALPRGLLRWPAQRIALLLRANSNLYESVDAPCVRFRYFDLFQPFEQLAAALAAYRPTVVVAPAQVLRALALKQLEGPGMAPLHAISVAEVLDARDRALIERAFGQPGELYQATEGFLASTCEAGTLHLNEEYLYVEKEWLAPAPDGRRRFVPRITDFSRFTQPIVRYRLDDILVARATGCPCARPTLALDAIEGRCDDQLLLAGRCGTPLPVFADVLARALAQVLPADADYRLVQAGPACLQLQSPLGADMMAAAHQHLLHVLDGLGVATAALTLDCARLQPQFDPTRKLRRIVRLQWP